MQAQQARFAPGEIVWSQNAAVKGVIVDVDPSFQQDEADLTEQLTPAMREQPWYSVLVDSSDKMIYVAEQHLESEPSEDPVIHSAMERFLGELKNGRYEVRRTLN